MTDTEIKGLDPVHSMTRAIEKHTIAIVDDDPFTTKLLEKMLGNTYRIITASNGNEGYDMVNLDYPDILLLDWMMPGLDGMSFLFKLKENPETSEIPVIFLSGKAEQASIDEAISAGATDFITKPFSKQNLLEKIDEILNLNVVKTETS